MSITAEFDAALAELRAIVGEGAVLHEALQRKPYERAIMHGKASESVLAVVCPTRLLQVWEVLAVAARYDLIVIAQAANTSLTGGSTPYGDYERPVLLLSMQGVQGLHVLREGEEVLALPACNLQDLEERLLPYGREPHSVLGSSCVGASVIGGVCNNSGGALLRRGPAYTEYALFARLNEKGEYELHNRLGIDLGERPEEILENLQDGQFLQQEIAPMQAPRLRYEAVLRDVQADTPARYNANPDFLFDASGSAGKLIVFAVRLPTYAKAKDKVVFLLSGDDEEAFARLRHDWLKSDLPLPMMAEYMDRHNAELTLKYGKDACFLMRMLSGRDLGKLWRFREKMSAFIPKKWTDFLMQGVSFFLPKALPYVFRKQFTTYAHHLLIEIERENERVVLEFLSHYNLQRQRAREAEGALLFNFRFASTAALLRFYDLKRKYYAELISTDIALPRNVLRWQERLPESLQAQCARTLSLGHFFCYVFHQDYFLKKGCDVAQFKRALLAFYQEQGVRCPAEHNVGHIYHAEDKLLDFYQKLDPCNRHNPGIGKSSRKKFWKNG